MFHLVRVIVVQGQIIGKIPIRRADGDVIGNSAMALQDFVHHLLAFDSMLEGPAHIDIIKGGHIGEHGKGKMLVACDLDDLDVGAGAQQGFGFEIHPVDDIHLPGYQGIHARRVVIDREGLDGVKPTGAPIFVVAFHPSQSQAHTGVEALYPIKPGADALGDRFLDLPGGIHADMVIRQQIGEIGITGLQRHAHFVIGDLFDPRDGFDNGLRRGFCTLGDMHVERGHHIIGVKGFAIVKSHAPAQLECPDFSIG